MVEVFTVFLAWFHEAGLQQVQAFWENLSGTTQAIIKAGSAFVAAALSVLLTIRTIFRWTARQRIAKQIREVAENPDAPDLDPNRATVVYVAQGYSPTEKLADTANEVFHHAKEIFSGRTVQPFEIAKTATTDEQWEIIAMREALNARGLHYLPKRVAFPIQLHLANQYLEWADAPATAKRLINDRLEEVEGGTFYAVLFNNAALEDMDKNPESGGGTTYFKKFFQPLMVSFAEEDFSRSAGSVDQRDALYRHLVYLSQHRVSAVRLTRASPRVDPKIVTETIPQPLPTAKFGKKGERATVAKWNREEACQAVLIVCEPDCLKEAELLENSIEQQWNASDVSPHVWTPVTDPAPEQACFLWQVP